jgi:hypothetical protein
MFRIRIGFNANLDPDPDLAFLVDADQDPRSRIFISKNWKKFTAERKF